MEALSKTLLPYKDIVGNVAMVVTIAQFFSGSFICKDIVEKKSTKGIAAIPFIGGIVVGVLMLKYGFLLGDSVMLIVNIVAIILNLIYLIIYYIYSENKWDDVLKSCAYGTALAAIFLGYAEWEDPQNLEYRYGLLVTILMLVLIGSPLLDLKEIIQKKDASSIPVPLTLMGTIVSFLWFLYGIILMNEFMIVQNLIGFTLCLVQMVLIVIYPGSASQSRGGQKTKKKSVKRE